MKSGHEAEIERLRKELELQRRKYEEELQLQADNREALLNVLEDLQTSQEKIEKARKEWNDAFDAVTNPIFIHDYDFRIVRANLAYAKASGKTIRDVIGLYYWEVFPKCDGPMPGCTHLRDIQGVNIEEEITLESGQTYVSKSYTIRDESGQYIHSIHILDDITESRRMSEALRESEKKFRSITTTAQDAVIMLNDNDRIVYWNPAAERTLGYSADEMRDCEFHIRMIPKRYHEEYRSGWSQFRETGKGPFVGNVIELSALRKDATEIPVELSVSALQLNGQWHAVGIIRDITKRKRAEMMVIESRDLLKSIVENIPTRVFWKDTKSRYLGCNTLFARSNGLSTPEDLIGKDDYEMNWREEAESYRADDKLVMETDKPKIGYEEPHTTPDGRTIWFRTSKVPLHDAQGKVFGMLGIADDITSEKKAAEILRHNEKILREAQRIGHLGNWEQDPRSGSLTWSDEVYRIFEINRDEFDATYAAFLEFIHPEDRRLVETTVRNHLENRVPFDLEHRLLLRNGKVKYVRALGESTYDGDTAIRTIGTIQDITRPKLLELELQQLNRALRTISSGNVILVHATDEDTLLQEMCSTIVEKGGYRLAWFGFVEHDENKTIRPVAIAGYDEGYTTSIQLTWADTERGQGPAGWAVRTGLPQTAQNIDTDQRFALWRDIAHQHGYASAISLPLKNQEHSEVYGVLNIYSEKTNAFNNDEMQLLKELAEDLSYGIINLREHQARRKTDAQLRDSLTETIRAIALTVEKRDPYTAGHQKQVAELCVAIGRKLNLDETKIEGLRLGATIHDIGKIYVPAEILNRPGKLTEPEFEMIKSHAQIGYDIIKDVRFPWPVGKMILQHHERMDGSGYPQGLKGDQIILEARILAVADVVEAMSSHRPYRPAIGLDSALTEIENNSGKLFDPSVVDACVKVFREDNFKF